MPHSPSRAALKTNNTMDILKVRELHYFLGEEIKKGNGNKELYVTTDEEGNDYRPMWFAPTSDPKEVEDFMRITCSGLRNCKDPKNAVLLG